MLTLFLLFIVQLKAKTELLLSAEAAKAAQKANMENSLETAQHALQDKQQVYPVFCTSGSFTLFLLSFSSFHSLLVGVKQGAEEDGGAGPEPQGETRAVHAAGNQREGIQRQSIGFRAAFRAATDPQ